MDRRAYERMEHEVRAIHRALTGEELRLDGSDAPSGAAPAPEEIEQRFAELAAEARALPGMAAQLSAMGFAGEASGAAAKSTEQVDAATDARGGEARRGGAPRASADERGTRP